MHNDDNVILVCDICNNECELGEINIREDLEGNLDQVCRSCERREEASRMEE